MPNLISPARANENASKGHLHNEFRLGDTQPCSTVVPLRQDRGMHDCE